MAEHQQPTLRTAEEPLILRAACLPRQFIDIRNTFSAIFY